MDENSLAPTLLLAMPQMQDPNFARSVVLLWRHERAGAVGLVINRPTETRVANVVEMTPPPRRDSGLDIWLGGPVEPECGWLLLGYDPGSPDTITIADGIFLSASVDVLRTVIETESTPAQPRRFFLGYAGWGDGQLESELAASAWLTVDVSRQLVFGTDPEVMWEAAIRGLGIDPYSLQMGSGVH